MTQAFNLSQLANLVNTSGQLNAASGLYNQAPVANGGTGASTLTANNVLLGNGTSPVQFVAPGASGNVLQSNGTTWSSAALAVVPIIQTQTIASGSGTWSKPTTGGYQWLQIELWGGGGSGGRAVAGDGGGGAGGGAYNTVTVPLSWLASSENYSVGAGGASKTTAGVGNVGGNTTFNITNYPSGAKTIAAYGGGGGAGNGTGSGGGGGGAMSAGASATGTPSGAGGDPDGGISATAAGQAGFSSSFGGGSGSTATTATALAGGSSYQGGGGGGGEASASGSGGNGGNSTFGGGGGGGGSDTGTGGTGGGSTFGGNGGNGGGNGGAPGNGVTPGGGGGGAENQNSGSGGNGQIRLTWW